MLNQTKMGNMEHSWPPCGSTRMITFILTEDCNLSCKYCYMTGKNKKHKMTFEVAKESIDYILSNRAEYNEEAIIWDFIGGEPTLEIDLMDQISDYLKTQMYLLDHPWFNRYRFAVSTNGLLYGVDKFQNYIKKNKTHLSVGVSIDGNQIKHDLQRVRPDGSGSYEDVIKNVDLWLQQFPLGTTKATFAHDDLPYLKDSIVSLWGLGVNTVAANVVFENVWEEGDDEIFEQQLKELADYILSNKLWNKYSVRFFDPSIGFPLTEKDMDMNFCGAGKMMSIDAEGNFYPCTRFTEFTLNKQSPIIIGNYKEGVSKDKLRPFQALNLRNQSNEECIACPVATGCAWCTGFNYDENGSIFKRVTYLCKMHKANVRANDYFWDEYSKITGLPSPRAIRGKSEKDSYLQFVMADDITPHCYYNANENSNIIMSKEIFEKGIEFARTMGWTPVLLKKGSMNFNYNNLEIPVYTPSSQFYKTDNCILLIKKNDIDNITCTISAIFKYCQRINLILQDQFDWDEQCLEQYSKQLDKIKAIIVTNISNGLELELNVLTDILNLDSMANCDCGETTFALAPNGKIYICPAFYFDNPQNYIGDIENGITYRNNILLKLERSPLCVKCTSYHCKRCKFLNIKLTNEVNVPSRIQCLVTNTERNKSWELKEALSKEEIAHYTHSIHPIQNMDPLINPNIYKQNCV